MIPLYKIIITEEGRVSLEYYAGGEIPMKVQGLGDLGVDVVIEDERKQSKADATH